MIVIEMNDGKVIKLELDETAATMPFYARVDN